jgi:hypothetical protein
MIFLLIKYQLEKLHAFKVLDQYQEVYVIVKVNVIATNVAVKKQMIAVVVDAIVGAHAQINDVSKMHHYCCFITMYYV